MERLMVNDAVSVPYATLFVWTVSLYKNTPTCIFMFESFQYLGL